jgi:hypothetical protein
MRGTAAGAAGYLNFGEIITGATRWPDWPSALGRRVRIIVKNTSIPRAVFDPDVAHACAITRSALLENTIVVRSARWSAEAKLNWASKWFRLAPPASEIRRCCSAPEFLRPHP